MMAGLGEAREAVMVFLFPGDAFVLLTPVLEVQRPHLSSAPPLRVDSVLACLSVPQRGHTFSTSPFLICSPG